MKILYNVPGVLFISVGLLLIALLSGCRAPDARGERPASTSMPASIVTADAIATATAATATTAPLVTFRRTGGFAGVSDHLAITADREAMLTKRDRRCEFTLGEGDFNQLVAKLDQADFPNLKDEYMPERPVPDAFTYTITYKGKTVKTTDTAVPDALRPALDDLNRIVQTEGRPQQ